MLSVKDFNIGLKDIPANPMSTPASIVPEWYLQKNLWQNKK